MTVWTIWVAGFCIVWFPGVLMARLLRVHLHRDWLVAFAVQLGLGMALWPVLLLWTSQIGWVWRPPVAQVFAASLVTLGLVSLLLPLRNPQGEWLRLRRQAYWIFLFALVVLITVATRILHIEGLALPLWVDSVHHVAIVRSIVDHGVVPATYDPFIPEGFFNYHWGLHALVSWTAWLLNRADAFDLADVLLHFGQLLNVLVVPMFYAAGRVLFGSRRAGLFSAVIVGVVSWFPAYFVSWGRYTHLAGILLMSPALIVLWQLRRRATFGTAAAAILLIAGLALVHVRVAFLAALLPMLLAVAFMAKREWRILLWWAMTAAGAFLLTLPWWLWLWQSPWVRTLVAVQTNTGAVWTDYNLPNWGLVWAPQNPVLIGLATAGISKLLDWQQGINLAERVGGAVWLVLVLGLGVWSWRSGRFRAVTVRAGRGYLLLLLWVILAALIMQSNRVGLPSVRFIHVNVGIIMLFVPLGLAVGGILAWLLGLLTPRRVLLPLTGVVVLAAALWGANGMREIINPSTVLATMDDRDALKWVRAHLPEDAVFAVNTWEWVRGVYAGRDGGYWIPVLADRASILPPAQYAAAWPRLRVVERNELLRLLATATNLEDASLRSALAEHGVTHLYLGAGRGTLEATEIDGKPYARLLYRQKGISIYELDLD